jgi:hypothetical protein
MTFHKARQVAAVALGTAALTLSLATTAAFAISADPGDPNIIRCPGCTVTRVITLDDGSTREIEGSCLEGFACGEDPIQIAPGYWSIPCLQCD